ncbi:FecR family protein [Sphingopyxis sp. LARHCG72]
MIGGPSAEDWLALMEGPDAAQYRAAFEAWHGDPANAKAYARLRSDFDAASQLSAGEIASLAGPHDAARRKRRQQWAIAAMVVLSLSAGLAWTAIGPDSQKPVIAAPAKTGEQRLDDGTLVALFDGAAIEPQFTDSERVVTMASGRARFTVAHDSSRPFRVVAGTSVTTALGTVFEVDLRSAAPRIRLLKGSVEVANRSEGGRALRLAPGESAEVGADGPRRVPALASSVATDKLEADKMPLGAIVDRANRVNARKIRLADPALAALPVSGRFEIGEGDALARKLAAALDLGLEAGPGGPVLKRR